MSRSTRALLQRHGDADKKIAPYQAMVKHDVDVV
jgi:hypothetical protein